MAFLQNMLYFFHITYLWSDLHIRRLSNWGRSYRRGGCQASDHSSRLCFNISTCLTGSRTSSAVFEARKSDTGDEKSGHLSRVCGDKNSWFWQELWMISNHDRGEENWTFLISSQVSRETLPYPGGCFACKPNQSMSAALSLSEDLRHVITVIQSAYFGFYPHIIYIF